MRFYCTLFDSGYLLRGLTLYRSLLDKDEDFIFYILCLDDISYRVISNLQLDNIVSIPLAKIENWDNELKEVKRSRKKVEYYFTLSPILPLYILKTIDNIDIITYLDADLFFYSSPRVLYDEMNDNSIFIIEHDYLKEAEHRFSGHGRYNVEYLSFRNDQEGISCLERWAGQCKNWCYDRVENGKYADQAYLDEWPALYKHLVVSINKGAGLAPWNCGKYEMRIDNDIYIGEDKLVFFHFHGVKVLSNCFISQNLRSYGARLSSAIKARLYKKYMREMKNTYNWLKTQGVNEIGFKDQVIGKRIKLKSDRAFFDRLRNMIESIYFVC